MCNVLINNLFDSNDMKITLFPIVHTWTNARREFKIAWETSRQKKSLEHKLFVACEMYGKFAFSEFHVTSACVVVVQQIDFLNEMSVFKQCVVPVTVLLQGQNVIVFVVPLVFHCQHHLRVFHEIKFVEIELVALNDVTHVDFHKSGIRSFRQDQYHRQNVHQTENVAGIHFGLFDLLTPFARHLKLLIESVDGNVQYPLRIYHDTFHDVSVCVSSFTSEGTMCSQRTSQRQVFTIVKNVRFHQPMLFPETTQMTTNENV